MQEITVNTIYDFKVKNIAGEEVSLQQYEGKVCLIVNTASKCGFTPQLNAMEDLYREFQKEGLEILAFPSNDFAGQEPLEGKAIEQFCQLNYEASYPIFDKVHVKGANTHPLFHFLSKRQLNGQFNSPPRWNFHKYLVDRQGRVIDYFYSFTSPTSNRVKKVIRKLLAK